jgi:hypothetical protein
LVELRYWQTSVIERIQAFLYKHDPDLTLDEASLTTLLRQGQFLLLIDGLNELPSEEDRRDVTRFEKDFAKAYMIFTTREISLGGELGLQKKLEMQPLTEPQMRQFVGNYLGQDKAEPLLRQLKDRLRELGQTPLLLAMLCSIFRSGEALPNNLGEVFRQFTQFYEQKLKGDVPDPYEHRDDWSKLLQCLAFAMMQGPDPKQQPKELSIAIPRTKAEQILTEFLQDREPYSAKTAERCLKDLLKHHLIQTNGGQIEFRHQLIQEYYAAEQLLEVCLSAIDALGNINNDSAASVLTRALNHQQSIIRHHASKALGLNQVKEYKKLEIHALLSVPGDNNKNRSAEGDLKRILLQDFLDSISEPDLKKSIEIAESLIKLGDGAVFEAFLQLFSNTSYKIQHRGIKVLGKACSLEKLINTLSIASSDIQAKGFEILKVANYQGLLKAFEGIFKVDDFDRDTFFANKLKSSEDDFIQELLFQALRCPDADIKWKASKALEILRNPSSLPSL